ncbi:GGDEF domain-containing protein [Actinocrispum sp. NPDC049592]|uniref:GGDEF domain-containing protein n=1 Tax=Actinocrispum sp. NPDC049592 TaxID=3154835 RepID=UPI003440B952
MTSFVFVPVTAADLGMFALLAGLGLVHAEVTRKIERIRRSLSVTPYINMTSVWMLPAALLLPMPLVPVLSCVLYLHLAFRRRMRRVAPHRTITNASTTSMASFASLLALHLVAGPVALTSSDVDTTTLAIFAAVAAYFVVDALITVIALYFAAPEKATARSLLGSFEDNALELTNLCLGALLLAALLFAPALSAAIFFPMFVLQKAVLAKQLEELASKDQKTGLLNSVAWHSSGNNELSRAGRTGAAFSVLMIDLDYFKKINDTFGHLAGDDMLIALADLLKRETRSHDLVGRFGGEEFVVLLAGSGEADALVAAERIRHQITEMVVQSRMNDGSPVTIADRSASIGVAAYPASGDTLEEVLAAADAAVYAAKRSGRNRVVGTSISDLVGTPG